MTLLQTIKQKQEFSALPDTYVTEKISDYFSTHPNIHKALETNGYNEKSKPYKQAVKEIRAGMREIYGVFQQASTEKRAALLDAYFEAKGRGEKLKILDKLLASHQSTKERKEHYKEVYEQIFLFPPTHILDLGCGLNPLAYDWLPGQPSYTACDLAPKDMGLLNTFFAGKGIDGEAFALDLLNPEARQRLQELAADTALLFKLIDTLETQERNVSKHIIKRLLANPHIKQIIISFPLQSIGGRTFRQGGKDNWFSKFLDEEEVTWDRLDITGEEFYRISL